MATFPSTTGLARPRAGRKVGSRLAVASSLLVLAACGQADRQAAAPALAPTSWRVYISNELSGDLTVIDGATNAVVSTIPVGKRPRGVRASRDGKTLYIALSGSPIGGPNV